ncbi:MAG TPA: hypothetical protein VE597_03745, partial [Geminicoccaceae bacterium]|nr:hypothetical protein [Geminicoccaceae bacterium]
MSRSLALVAGLLLGVVALVSGTARAQSNDAAARNEMVRIVELETMMLSGQTGIAEIDPRVLDAMREV